MAKPVERESHCTPVAGATEPWRTAPRWWYLLRYHRASQLAMRLVRVVHNRSARRLWHGRVERLLGEAPSRRVNAGLAALSQRKLAVRGMCDAARGNAERIFRGQFCFLQHEITLPDPIDWRCERTGAAHLWRFHLHYHDFLLDLAAQGISRGEDRWLARAWAMVLDWIDVNRLDDRRVLGDAWHPYCIARRLPAWIHLWSAAPPREDAQPRVLGSMIGQAHYLEHHLEWDLRGNHLLENLRALALTGAFFEGPDAQRWLSKLARWLPWQLDEQVLPHGEHFERSPGYHVEMLEAILDMRDSLAGVAPGLARLCGETAARMADFLQAILHPDGGIPLLGDSCLHEGEPLSHLLERAGEEDTMALSCPDTDSLCFTDGTRRVPATVKLFTDGTRCVPATVKLFTDGTRRVPTTLKRPATGHGRANTVAIASRTEPDGGQAFGDYWVYRHTDDFLLFDAGPVGADPLPAHAHADLLTLEASVGGRRIIVDSGVFSYDDEPMRHHCRSTAAHNILQIDRTDQCDMWSRFRMGYRGRPSRLESGSEQGFAWARATHNAYRRLGVPQVGRWLAGRPGGPWLCADWARGAGHHQLTSRLHFHPEVTVRPLGDGTMKLEHAGQELRLAWLTPGNVTVEPAWYCPRLGQRAEATAVRWETTLPLPAVCGWCLTWAGNAGTATLERSASGEILLNWSEPGLRWIFPAFPGAPAP